MKANNKDIDPFIEDLEKMFKDYKPNDNYIMWTGKEGLILMEVSFREAFSGRKFTDEERAAVRKEVEESKIWEEGLYEIGGDPYIKYVELQDPDHPDGDTLVKVQGRWYVERWRDGWRTHYKIITEEEAQEIINDPETKPIKTGEK